MSRFPFEKLTPAAKALIRRAINGRKMVTPSRGLSHIARAAFWHGYAKGARDLDLGCGQKLAERDQRLGEAVSTDECERFFERSEPCLIDNINPTFFAKVVQHLTAHGVEIAPELIAALDIDAIVQLERCEFTRTADLNHEHPAPRVVGNDHAVHIGTPCGQAESVDPAGAAGEVDKPRATTAIHVLDNIKQAIGALSAHGEHRHVDQLLDVTEVATDLAKSHRNLYQAYVRLLEASSDRIRTLGGTCHPVDVMERNDVALAEARAVISRIAGTP